MIYSALSVILTHHGRKNEKHNVGKIYFGGNKGIPTKDEKFTGVGNYEFQKKFEEILYSRLRSLFLCGQPCT